MDRGNCLHIFRGVRKPFSIAPASFGRSRSHPACNVPVSLSTAWHDRPVWAPYWSQWPSDIIFETLRCRSRHISRTAFLRSGLLIDEMRCGAQLHTTSCMSQKWPLRINLAPSSEILDAVEAIYEGKVLTDAFRLLPDDDIELFISLDLKHLIRSFSTLLNSVDCSVRANVNFIRFEFETKRVNKIYLNPREGELCGTKYQTWHPIDTYFANFLALTAHPNYFSYKWVTVIQTTPRVIFCFLSFFLSRER